MLEHDADVRRLVARERYAQLSRDAEAPGPALEAPDAQPQSDQRMRRLGTRWLLRLAPGSASSKD
jgi:hypothetical protein